MHIKLSITMEYARRENEGVSPIVSILLLIVISIVAAVIAYVWINSFQGRLTQHASAPRALGICLKIDGVEIALKQADGVAYRIWLKNCGSQTLHLDYVYLLDASGNAYYTYYAGRWSIPPQDTEYLWLWVPNEHLRIDERTTIKVVTAEGIEAYYVFTPG